MADGCHLEFRFLAIISASINIFAPNLVPGWKIDSPRRPIAQKLCFRIGLSKMEDGFNLEFRFRAIIWTLIKIFDIVIDNQQTGTTYLNSEVLAIQHARHRESHHVPTTHLRIEILHRIWYLDGKLCPDDGMFTLAIRNKFNTV